MPLEERQAICFGGCKDKSCQGKFCGFARLWTKGVRRSLFQLSNTTLQMELKPDVHPVWSKRTAWQEYTYVKVKGTASEAYGSKEKKELRVVDKSGTVVEFLDHFEEVLTDHLFHRATLARLKAADLELERNCRPGGLRVDEDFGENGGIAEARPIQSQYWMNKAFTIYMIVAGYLDWAAWDAEVGDLPEGAEVTVHGERAGQPVNGDSFWAKVIKTDQTGHVHVENATGEPSSHARADLRHRQHITRAFVGITGDKLHDSYQMQHWRTEMLRTLHNEGVLRTQRITHIHVHTDNAAAHFKSSKSLDSLTQHLGTVTVELPENDVTARATGLGDALPRKIVFTDADKDRITFEAYIQPASDDASDSCRALRMKVGSETVLEPVTALEANLLTGVLRDEEESLVLPHDQRQTIIQQLQVMCRWAEVDLALKGKSRSAWADIGSLWWSFGCPGHGKASGRLCACSRSAALLS